MRFLVVAIGFALAAGPAFATEPLGAAPKTADDRDKVVCKKERPTGSHLPVRVCLTKAEWEGLSEAAHETLKDAKARPSKGVGSGPPLPVPQ